MNTRMNFVVALLLVVAIALGALIGVTAGTYLFDLAYSESGETDQQEESTPMHKSTPQ